MKRLILICITLLSSLTQAVEFNYKLTPQKVAKDVYVFIGHTADFDTANGGNIVNTGFIIAPEGVLVIDTGPSLRYGQQMRQAIATVTQKPVVQALNTHHHPDHFLGNQAFADVPIASLPEIQTAIASEGNAFAENLYRMSGDWMTGTEVRVPTQVVGGGVIELAGRRLRLLALAGHTGADLAIFDETSGVLFAGDLVFNDRAPTTPHAQIDHWLASLVKLESLTQEPSFRALVPGHGAVTGDSSSIDRTRVWLNWLTETFQAAAIEGMDMNEVLARPLPEKFRNLPVAENEYRRSVGHLFPAIELEVLERTHTH